MMRAIFVAMVGVVIGPAVGGIALSRMAAGRPNFWNDWQESLVLGYLGGTFPAIFWAAMTIALPLVIASRTLRVLASPLVGLAAAFLPYGLVFAVAQLGSVASGLGSRTPPDAGEIAGMALACAMVAGGVCGLIVELLWTPRMTRAEAAGNGLR